MLVSAIGKVHSNTKNKHKNSTFNGDKNLNAVSNLQNKKTKKQKRKNIFQKLNILA